VSGRFFFVLMLLVLVPTFFLMWCSVFFFFFCVVFQSDRLMILLEYGWPFHGDHACLILMSSKGCWASMSSY